MVAAFKHHKDYLLSDAANQYREVIELLEPNKELKNYTRANFLLFTLEYQRKNYNAAIDCLGFIKNDTSCTEVASLYYQLIMLRLEGRECQILDFENVIKREYKKGNEAISNVFKEAVFTFRAHKMYDFALGLELALGSQMRSNGLKNQLSLALTSLEQYRVEFKKIQRSKKEDIQMKCYRSIHAIINMTMMEYPPKDNHSFEYALVLAQWYYIIHAVFDDEKVAYEMISMASAMVLSCLESTSQLLPTQRCFTCDQAVTSTEVKYVCSGCRVVCYCSIDHQRATWKNEAWKGMRIGHEVLCPLYKAYRKYTHARDLKDEEKELRMKRRLDRESRKFLEYGLGLKNKCVPCNDEVRSLFLKPFLGV